MFDWSDLLIVVGVGLMGWALWIATGTVGLAAFVGTVLCVVGVAKIGQRPIARETHGEPTTDDE